ncbi:hypothetical protein D4764_06G0010990 [Takifugu flavidus]|uniref:Uncharacterized protein n=1 Tax=Takifugu flavidus TaxID=433684 RepID=A0A5C6MXM6_9TELE|nr:hypothetical protein D4764_06G0010990 [Takifugu flavidus]
MCNCNWWNEEEEEEEEEERGGSSPKLFFLQKRLRRGYAFLWFRLRGLKTITGDEIFCSFLFVALWCLEARGSGPPGDGGRSCSPCPANCSCVLATGPQHSCVVNCTNIGLERAPAAADIPLATSVL